MKKNLCAVMLFFVGIPLRAMEQKTKVPPTALSDVIQLLRKPIMQRNHADLYYVPSSEHAFACLYVMHQPVPDAGVLLVRVHSACHRLLSGDISVALADTTYPDEKELLAGDAQYAKNLMSQTWGLPQEIGALMVLVQTKQGQPDAADLDTYETYRQQAYQVVKDAHDAHIPVYLVEEDVAAMCKVARLIRKKYQEGKMLTAAEGVALEQCRYQKSDSLLGQREQDELAWQAPGESAAPSRGEHYHDRSMKVLGDVLVVAPVVMCCSIL